MELSADVVVVGLGLSGLSASMSLAAQGLSVIGVQQYATSGAVGTSSTGLTRIFRITQNDPELQERAKYDFKEWRKIEKETMSSIIHMRGGLNIGPQDNPDIKLMLKSQLQEGDEVLNYKEVMERWPALKVPPNYVGIYSRDMGFINVKAALSALKTLAQKNGAKLHYHSEVTSLDEKKKRITVRKGDSVWQVSYKVGVVMCCGPYSPGFKDDPSVARIETEYFKIRDSSGMPEVGLFYDTDPLYWMTNDPEEKNLKIGLHCPRSLFKLIERMKQMLPSKIEELVEAHPCFYTMRKPDKGLNIYREGDIVWAYGYCGHGFKHGPSIGALVRDKVKEMEMKPKL